MPVPHYPEGASLTTSAPAVGMKTIWDALREAPAALDCPMCMPNDPCIGHRVYAVDSALRKTGALKGLQYHVPLGAFTLLVEERARVLEDEGFDTEHDGRHTRGELAAAAACYAMEAARQTHALRTGEPSASAEPPIEWPWEAHWWKPGDGTDPLRLMVKAGQLIVAEIDGLFPPVEATP